MPSPAEEAFKATIGELATRTHLETLTAGREVVAKSAKRWRRVTDGKPCGFCAMLASRGPVYTSARDAGQGNAYHGRCGCTVEPFDGNPDDWVPTAEEQRYIDAYNAAYRPGMKLEDLADEISAKLTQGAGKVLSIDGLTDEAADELMARMFEDGDYDGAARIGELLDARTAATAKPAARDVTQDFHPAAYEWFEELTPDQQNAYLAQFTQPGLREDFLQEQWAHINGRSAPKLAGIPKERQIRADWDLYLETEWLKLEEATNGHAMSKKAPGHVRLADLYRVNERTARAWASEETLNYWQDNGRMTYGLFRDMYRSENAEGRERARNMYWTN